MVHMVHIVKWQILFKMKKIINFLKKFKNNIKFVKDFISFENSISAIQKDLQEIQWIMKLSEITATRQVIVEKFKTKKTVSR